MTSIDQIWHDYQVRLLGFIRHRIAEPEIAEDILQDVFVKVQYRIGALAEVEHIQGWLYQITRNTIIDYYRTRKITEPLAEDTIAVEELLDDYWVDLSMCVLPMIKMLPEIYCNTLILFEIDGLPLQDVAKRLNLSMPGAKSRVQRGRIKLKEIFLNCCQFEFDCQGNPIEWSPRDGCPNLTC